MIGAYFGHNLEIKDISFATISLGDVNYTYGYGVYETLKLRRGVLYFAELHAERLCNSAALLTLGHQFKQEAIPEHIRNLVRKNGILDANIKVLLIGRGDALADLYVIMLNPLFPDRKDYKNGAQAVSWDGERWMPEAKSLNMLMSSMAYRHAQKIGAYDAIFRDRYGILREGTRTNFFLSDGNRIVRCPETSVLYGVTMRTVEQALTEAGVPIVIEELTRVQAKKAGLHGAFLTSTSTKIMPLQKIDDEDLIIYPSVYEWMKIYDAWLTKWADSQDKLV